MKSRLSRKWLGAPIAVWLLILMMGTALALLISSKQTANEAFQAKAIGTVNIGNMESDGWLSSWALQGSLEPGASRTQCFTATLNSPQPGDALRLYAGNVAGPLADHMTIRLIGYPETSGQPAGLAGGAPACGGSTTQVPIIDSAITLNQFKAQYGSYASGIPLVPGRSYMWIVALPSTVDGTAVAGQTASMSVFFENQG